MTLRDAIREIFKNNDKVLTTAHVKQRIQALIRASGRIMQSRPTSAG